MSRGPCGIPPYSSPPIPSGTKDTLRVSSRSPSSFEVPFVIGLGECDPQKIRILQFFKATGL